MGAGGSGTPDENVVDGVPSQGTQVPKVTGEHRRSAHCIGESDDDGVDRRRLADAAYCRSQRRALASEGIVGGEYLAGAQEAVLVEVTAVVAREGFGQDHRRYERRPLAPAPQLGQTGSVLGQQGKPARVEDQGHAERFGLAANSLSTQAVASVRSASVVGPSSASSSAR